MSRRDPGDDDGTMCFSATASFAAFGVLTFAGTAVLRRAARLDLGPGLTFLSSFPLVFGIQQGFEGMVWLGINDELPAALRGVGAYGFLFFALFFWPVAGPLAGHLIETRPVRRRLFVPLIVGGVAIGLYLMFVAIRHAAPPMAGPEWGGHVAYLLDVDLPSGVKYLYFFTACAALLASSNRTAFRFGLALTIAFAVTLVGYELKALPSVWCFFAALCSLVIVHAVWRGDTRTETSWTRGDA